MPIHESPSRRQQHRPGQDERAHNHRLRWQNINTQFMKSFYGAHKHIEMASRRDEKTFVRFYVAVRSNMEMIRNLMSFMMRLWNV